MKSEEREIKFCYFFDVSIDWQVALGFIIKEIL